MQSKLEAVRITTAVGASVIVAGGTQPGVLDRLMDGDDVGTLFRSTAEAVPAWKRWIGYTVTPKGKLHVDAGAARAVQQQGKSLLAIGITRVEGNFDQGELVSVLDPVGREIARGLSNYEVDIARQLIGKRSDEIEAILGHLPYGSVVHRDNLAVLRQMD
ncbi:MAG: PUA domain-containing protein [Planctomycetaceae bacterium]